MAETTHSKGEMGVNLRCFPPNIGIVGGGTVAVIAGDGSDEEDKANAARLALAWNSHDELVARADRAEAVLRKLEWAGRNLMPGFRGAWWQCCPSCDGAAPGSRMVETGHRPGCELAAMLAETKGAR